MKRASLQTFFKKESSAEDDDDEDYLGSFSEDDDADDCDISITSDEEKVEKHHKAKKKLFDSVAPNKKKKITHTPLTQSDAISHATPPPSNSTPVAKTKKKQSPTRASSTSSSTNRHDERYTKHLDPKFQAYIQLAKEYLYRHGYRFKLRAMIILATREPFSPQRMDQVIKWAEIMRKSFIDEHISELTLKYHLGPGVIYDAPQ